MIRIQDAESRGGLDITSAGQSKGVIERAEAVNDGQLTVANGDGQPLGKNGRIGHAIKAALTGIELEPFAILERYIEAVRTGLHELVDRFLAAAGEMADGNLPLQFLSIKAAINQEAFLLDEQ